MNPFRSLRDYEEYVYTLKQHFPSIQRLTLVVVQRGRRVAALQGELTFAQGYRITIGERLSFDAGSVEIEFYGYELWHEVDKFAWYDAQPHPNDPMLASTYPHHKHILPNIKRNRIPAPNMNFTRPNLSALIREIEELGLSGISQGARLGLPNPSHIWGQDDAAPQDTGIWQSPWSGTLQSPGEPELVKA